MKTHRDEKELFLIENIVYRKLYLLQSLIEPWKDQKTNPLTCLVL